MPGGVVRGHAQQRQQLSLQQYAVDHRRHGDLRRCCCTGSGTILTPFLIGAILAYIGNPAVSWGETHRVPRTVGTLVVLAVTILVVFGLILVLTPLVHSEFTQLMQRLPDLAVLLQTKFAPWLQEKFGITLELDLASIKAMIADEPAGRAGADAESAVERQGRRHDDPRHRDQPGADSGGDVLSAARLERDSGAGRGADAAALAGQAATVAVEVDDVLAEFLRGQASVMIVLATYYAVAL